MKLFDLMFLSIGLASDAFAISISKGLSMHKINIIKIFIIGLYFGLFQMFMPILGYYLGSTFEKYISIYDHWIVFIILIILGINMIRSKKDDKIDESIEFTNMFLLSLATSIDAFSVGITFSFFNYNILYITSIIGSITFIICLVGCLLGYFVGNNYSEYANKFGGFILVLIGTKVLIEHLLLY